MCLQNLLEIKGIPTGTPDAVDGRHSNGAATPQLHNNFAAKVVQKV